MITNEVIVKSMIPQIVRCVCIHSQGPIWLGALIPAELPPPTRQASQRFLQVLEKIPQIEFHSRNLGRCFSPVDLKL